MFIFFTESQPAGLKYQEFFIILIFINNKLFSMKGPHLCGEIKAPLRHTHTDKQWLNIHNDGGGLHLKQPFLWCYWKSMPNCNLPRFTVCPSHLACIDSIISLPVTCNSFIERAHTWLYPPFDHFAKFTHKLSWQQKYNQKKNVTAIIIILVMPYVLT